MGIKSCLIRKEKCKGEKFGEVKHRIVSTQVIQPPLHVTSMPGLSLICLAAPRVNT
jgi:hypothetical protein